MGESNAAAALSALHIQLATIEHAKTSQYLANTHAPATVSNVDQNTIQGQRP
jgi:hypothetical protein